MGREVVVALTDGRLDAGTWEQIFYGEFVGRRRKRVLVKIIGEEEHFCTFGTASGLDFSLELDGSVELDPQRIDVDEGRLSSDTGRYV